MAGVLRNGKEQYTWAVGAASAGTALLKVLKSSIGEVMEGGSARSYLQWEQQAGLELLRLIETWLYSDE